MSRKSRRIAGLEPEFIPEVEVPRHFDQSIVEDAKKLARAYMEERLESRLSTLSRVYTGRIRWSMPE